MTEAARSLEDHHQLITEGRDTGNGHALSMRSYPSGDAEMTAIRLYPDDRLRRGGGGKRKNSEKIEMNEETHSKSLRRARSTVRRKLLTLCADRLLTLTFKENITDIDEAWNCFKYFCRLMRSRYGEPRKDRNGNYIGFEYVAVPEYQARGAVHFHLAIRGYYHANTVRRLWLRATGNRGGNIDITSPRKAKKNGWNPRHIANYLAKYITKTEKVEFNRRRFSSSATILVPEPLTGWLALGVPLISVMRQTVESITHRQITTIWESEGYFGCTYLST